MLSWFLYLLNKKQGIDDLLENILLVAEVMELKANPNRKAYGVSYRGST